MLVCRSSLRLALRVRNHIASVSMPCGLIDRDFRPPAIPALRHPGSVISTLVAYPIDVIKTRMIVSGSGGAVTKGMGETLVDILQLRLQNRFRPLQISPLNAIAVSHTHTNELPALICSACIQKRRCRCPIPRH